MSDIPLDQIIAAWAGDRKNIPTRQASVEIQIKYHILQLLAQGQSATAEKVAGLTGFSVATIDEVLGELRAGGCEYDREGDIVGCALSLNPTPYQFHVNGQQLYAWCALDTLFLPGQIGQTAQVHSRCPVTGKSIRLTVTPEGISQVTPSEAVISVVLPGITPRCSPDRKAGPESPSCTQMHFFSSGEAAESWLHNHPHVAILSLEDAFELARVIWIEPYARLAKSGS